jgi:hypothetical protein
MRRTLLPRMGYREATTHIQLWLLGALISHSEFDVVDFLICEIEDTVLDVFVLADRCHMRIISATSSCG